MPNFGVGSNLTPQASPSPAQPIPATQQTRPGGQSSAANAAIAGQSSVSKADRQKGNLETPDTVSSPAFPQQPTGYQPQQKSSPVSSAPPAIRPFSAKQADVSEINLPKEESVEEIENEFLAGASPAEHGKEVIAGESKIESEKEKSISREQTPKKLEPKETKTQEEFRKPLAEKNRPYEDEADVKAKADAARMPYVNLTGFAISPETLKLIPEEAARKYQAVPYLKINHNIRIAALNPKAKEVTGAIGEILSEQDLEPLYSYCSKASLKYALGNYKFLIKDKEAEREDKKEKGQEFQKIRGFAQIKNQVREAPTTKLFDVITSGAIKENASDIHVEPAKEKARVRYRIDGILQDVVDLEKDAYESLISRIKFLAKMKMDLKNLPQDGRFAIKAAEVMIDLRVSTLPTVWGEGLVIRLLKQEKGMLNLSELGFDDHVLEMIREASDRPTGMILNTGPTGSGKTTTLYAILSRVNKPGVKIITLEDPVEYRIPGITQSQVDSYAKYSFATGLRSLLRQDPDIVMVGEIRDLETARISLNAAMTGHLVLTTLHTNNATSAPSRFLEFGVKPFLIVGNINLIIAQRLVRKLCPECKTKYKPRPGILEAIKKILPEAEKPAYLWKTEGCAKCQGTGYLGRTAVVEAFKPGGKIEKMVLEAVPADKIREEAISEGMKTMEADGIEKALAGITTIQEVWRVTKE